MSRQPLFLESQVKIELKVGANRCMIELKESQCSLSGTIILKKEKLMPQFFLTDADPWNDNVDLADALAFSVTNVSKATVRINVDYLMDGNWINALTSGGPFTLRPAQSRTVAKQNLVAEIVRVKVTGNNFRVSVEF